jgi:hypothetical protein
LVIAASIVTITVLLFAPTARSGTHPTSPEARAWRAPAGFIRQALCIHRHESSGNWHRRWVDWRGAPSDYAGGMQFMQDTWERAGGRGEPWQWSPREQVYRAWRIWRLYPGGSWSEWGTAGLCGLR